MIRRRLWGRLDVALRPGEDPDELAGKLAPGSRGAEIGERVLRIWFPSLDAARARAAALAAERAVEVHAVEEEPWLERYIEGLGPVPAGRRFVVIPRAGLAHPEDRIPLHIRPGRAFGTGEHATTQLCVEALERWVEPGSRWLDLGTGTGILALVAAYCGARELWALDVDPEAVAVARETVARHGMEGRIRVAEGSLPAAARPPFDGIVANVAPDFFVQEARSLRGALRPGGYLIASGFPLETEAETLAACTREGLTLLERRECEAWVAAVLRRSGA